MKHGEDDNVFTIRAPKIFPAVHKEDRIGYTEIPCLNIKTAIDVSYASPCVRGNVNGLSSLGGWKNHRRSCHSKKTSVQKRHLKCGAAPSVERTRARVSQYFDLSDAKASVTYTGGYNRKVSSETSVNDVSPIFHYSIPLMTAFKYFISRKSSNVGLLELPTTVKISSRSLWSTSGC